MNGYAVIGWGSLIWDLENLAEHVEGAWAMGAGPALPLEFSRVSPKRKMGLVVCIDAEHGVGCPTHVIASRRSGIDAVFADLARRERAPAEMIGAICRATGRRTGVAAEIVGDWCADNGFRGAVWTSLPANFREHAGEAFSLERGEAWLRGLAGESLDEAVRYIENAPAATDTPLRRRLAGLDWWRAEAERVLPR
jgi:hypothetical protein